MTAIPITVTVPEGFIRCVERECGVMTRAEDAQFDYGGGVGLCKPCYLNHLAHGGDRGMNESAGGDHEPPNELEIV